MTYIQTRRTYKSSTSLRAENAWRGHGKCLINMIVRMPLNNVLRGCSFSVHPKLTCDARPFFSVSEIYSHVVDTVVTLFSTEPASCCAYRSGAHMLGNEHLTPPQARTDLVTNSVVNTATDSETRLVSSKAGRHLLFHFSGCAPPHPKT